MTLDLYTIARLLYPKRKAGLKKYSCEEAWEKFIQEFAMCVAGVGASDVARRKTIKAHKKLQNSIFRFSYKEFYGEVFDGDEEALFHQFGEHVSTISDILGEESSSDVVDYLIGIFNSADAEDADAMEQLLAYIQKENGAKYFVQALSGVLPKLKTGKSANAELLIRFIES